MFDLRSSAVIRILQANPSAYETLVLSGDTPALARELLANVNPTDLLDRKPPSILANHLTLAGLWLWHDGLGECHAIAQQSPQNLLARGPTPRLAIAGDLAEPSAPETLEAARLSLDFWHAIMHRREGDFSNSKYWYARAAGHPILTAMANHLGPAVNTMPADRILLRMVARGFDAGAWVDFIQDVHQNPTPSRLAGAVHLQQLEWRALFDYCTQL